MSPPVFASVREGRAECKATDTCDYFQGKFFHGRCRRPRTRA